MLRNTNGQDIGVHRRSLNYVLVGARQPSSIRINRSERTSSDRINLSLGYLSTDK